MAYLAHNIYHFATTFRHAIQRVATALAKATPIRVASPRVAQAVVVEEEPAMVECVVAEPAMVCRMLGEVNGREDFRRSEGLRFDPQTGQLGMGC